MTAKDILSFKHSFHSGLLQHRERGFQRKLLTQSFPFAAADRIPIQYTGMASYQIIPSDPFLCSFTPAGTISEIPMKSSCGGRWKSVCCIGVCLTVLFQSLVTSFSPPSSSCLTKEQPWAPQQYPNLFPYLSILIPAYNEEERIGKTLSDYQAFLEEHPYWSQKDCCQIVIANDGSTDGTAEFIEAWLQNNNSKKGFRAISISCINLAANMGKGAALATGIEWIISHRPDSWILTADADGSAPLDKNLNAVVSCVEEWYQNTQVPVSLSDRDEKKILVGGYRTYASSSPSRLLFRCGFRTVVRTVVGDLGGIRDSQCGFKLISPAAATALYRHLHLPSWSHDVEVLYRAVHSNVTLLEQAVTWQDQPGSKLVASPGGVLAVCVQMFIQVLELRWNYERGVWKIVEDQAICRR